MTDQPRKRITIDAPSEMTILAARHLDATEGRVQVGTTVDSATRAAISQVLRYVSTAHKAPAAAAEAERDQYRAAILDIDAHATPIGLANQDDPDGNPHHYAVTVGALHRALGKVGNTAASCTAEAERDGAYRERAHLVALVASVAEQAVIAPAPDVDDPGWQILYITLHGRQCSWHIAPRDADLFEHLDHVGAGDPRAQWDGHTTDEKYRHIDWIARALGTPGPFRKD
ncbi:hypothetical protein ACWCRD_02720 [Streptomyces sp. NPDC002092]